MYSDDKVASIWKDVIIGYKVCGQQKKCEIAFLVLRAFKRDYYRVIINGLDSSNIRPYAPSKGQFTPKYKEFFQVNGNASDIMLNENDLKKLFKDAVETIDDDKKLKVNMDDHHRLEDIFNGTFNYS